MNRKTFVLAMAAGALMVGGWAMRPGCAQDKQKKRVLVISQAAGFRHSSIPVAAAAVRFLGA
ncbi:MAG TPA: hypothetical protein VK689_13705, partial [Armatimonadota bacterium]|nr:hypothetical protein [Armatimonadota bacterium]